MPVAFLANGAVSKANVNASMTPQRFIYRPNRAGIIIYITHLFVSILDDACFEGEYGAADTSIVTGLNAGVEVSGASGAFSPLQRIVDFNGATDANLANAFMMGSFGADAQVFRHDITAPAFRCQYYRIRFYDPIECSRNDQADQQFTVYLDENYATLIDHRFAIAFFESTQPIPKYLFHTGGR